MPATVYPWIKQRLPDQCAFTKNGVTQTVDEAVAAAVAENTAYVSSRAGQMAALGDLLEILAADVKFDSEQEGEYRYSKSRLQEMANNWHDRAAAEEQGIAAPAGGFSFVPATFRNSAASTDEFSR